MNPPTTNSPTVDLCPSVVVVVYVNPSTVNSPAIDLCPSFVVGAAAAVIVV